MPLTAKIRRGAPKKTAKALVRQANDLQTDDIQVYGKRKIAAIDEDEEEVVIRKSKRSKKVWNCCFILL